MHVRMYAGAYVSITRTCVCVCVCVRVHADMHTGYINISSHSVLESHAYTFIHTYIHACMHTYIPALALK